MRGILAAAAIAAAFSFAAAPATFAAQAKPATTQTGTMAAHGHVTTGTLTAFDMTAHTLKLKNGTTYMLPSDFKDPGLKVGSKVRVSWNMENGKHQATGVSALR